jgi:hypothetical protein
VLYDALTAYGHSVSTAATGPEALAQIALQVPDVVLLDVMMPGMTGFEVCERLRADPRASEVPVVMVTALEDRQSRLRGIAAGADEFLTKPVDLVELRVRLHSLARVNRYRRLVEERERAVKALTEARDAALAAARLKSEFLTIMSHELRTPLNGIMGMTELLLGTTLDAEQREFAELTLASSNELLQLITDILDFADVAAGRTQVATALFPLSAAVLGSVALLHRRAWSKRLEVDVAIAPEVPSQVHGDDGRLRHALTKLLDNAIKFSPDGAGPISVAVDIVAETEHDVTVRISVRDHGIGIAEPLLDRIWAPFSQGDTSSTRSYGGAGLGLSSAKQSVELMGGALGCESMPGQGSTFWFTVPLGKAVMPVLDS